MFYWFMIVLIFIPLIIIYPTRIYGKKNVKFKGKAIYICNHLSNMDPIVLNHKVGRWVRPLGKKELFKNKLAAVFFKGLGVIPIDRSGNDIAATKQVLKALKEDKRLLIFPEGTRNKTSEDMSSVKHGACMFAIKAKAPIVPCCFIKKFKIFRRNILVVGKPYELSEYYDMQLSKEVLDSAAEIISKSITDLKDAYLKQQEERKIVKQLK